MKKLIIIIVFLFAFFSGFSQIKTFDKIKVKEKAIVPAAIGLTEAINLQQLNDSLATFSFPSGNQFALSVSGSAWSANSFLSVVNDTTLLYGDGLTYSRGLRLNGGIHSFISLEQNSIEKARLKFNERTVGGDYVELYSAANIFNIDAPSINLGSTAAGVAFFNVFGTSQFNDISTFTDDVIGQDSLRIDGDVLLKSDLTVIGDILGSNLNISNWNDAYTHITESGASHTFIDQSVTTTSSPDFQAARMGSLILNQAGSTTLTFQESTSLRAIIKYNTSTTIFEIYSPSHPLHINKIGDQNVFFGDGATEFGGTIASLDIPSEATDVDKFLVSNAGLIKYRTGDELLSDIGGASASLYWKNDGTSAATGNWDLGIYSLTAASADINGNLEANTAQFYGTTWIQKVDDASLFYLYRDDAVIGINDIIGSIRFGGTDGGNSNAAYMEVIADPLGGNWGATDTPSKISFGTTPNGSATSIDGLVIDMNQDVSLPNGGLTAETLKATNMTSSFFQYYNGTSLVNSVISQSGGNLDFGGTGDFALTSVAPLSVTNETAAILGTQIGTVYNLWHSGSSKVNAGLIGFKAEGTWTSTSGTRQSAFFVKTVVNGSTVEKFTISSIGDGWFAGGLNMDGLLIQSETSGITASTTQAQGQQPLITNFNEISTVANAFDAITLPPAQAGLIVYVTNTGVNQLGCYPASGDQIDALGVNNKIDIGATSKRFIAVSSSLWISSNI